MVLTRLVERLKIARGLVLPPAFRHPADLPTVPPRVRPFGTVETRWRREGARTVQTEEFYSVFAIASLEHPAVPDWTTERVYDVFGRLQERTTWYRDGRMRGAGYSPPGSFFPQFEKAAGPAKQ